MIGFKKQNKQTKKKLIGHEISLRSTILAVPGRSTDRQIFLNVHNLLREFWYAFRDSRNF